MIISCWLESGLSLIDLAISIGNFAFDATNWKNNYVPPYEGKFMFSSTWPVEGQEKLIYIGLSQEEKLAALTRRAEEGEVSGLSLLSPACWRNPFILEPEVFTNWGSTIRISADREPGNRYSIHLVFREGGLWFSSTNNDFSLFDKDSLIISWKRSGYRLHVAEDQGGWKLPEWGVKYMPAKTLTQENRRRLIEGAIRFLGAFNPKAASLQAWNYGEYNWDKHTIEILKNGKAYMFYYRDFDTPVRILNEYPTPVEFPKLEIDGVSIYAEESHFGFLR